MDLDEMKDRMKKVKAPGIERGELRGRLVDDLIAALKVEDARDKKMLRRTMKFFAIAGVFYVSLFVLTWIAPPDESPNLHRVLLGTFAMVFLSVGVFSWRKSRALHGVDYAEPVRAFLADAAQRYKFLQVKDLMIVIPYLVLLSITCTVALMKGAERYVPSLDPAVVLIFSCVLLPIAWAGGFLLGLREWKRRKEPLLDEIKKMQAKLANGDQT